MNRMDFTILSTVNPRRLFVWAVACCLAWNMAAKADTYQNTSVSIYYSPFTQGQFPPPTIDDTGFDNESTFEVNFSVPVNKAILYETSDTL